MTPRAASMAWLLVVAGCAAAKSAPPPRAGVQVTTAKAPTPAAALGVRSGSRVRGRPRVVLIAGGASCAGGMDSSLTDVAKADMALLASTFGERFGTSVTTLEKPDPLRVREALLSSPPAPGTVGPTTPADNGAGLIVFYSGHGYVTQDNRSALCMPGEERDRSVEALLASFLRDAKGSQLPSWIFMILNACESAYVDVSRLDVPTAVLAASRFDVDVHHALAPRCEAELGAVPRLLAGSRPTTLATVLASLLARRNDANCDGVLSDQELFDSLRSVLARCLDARGDGAPLPTLRRQASGPLPLLSLAGAPSCPSPDAFGSRLSALASLAREDPELSTAIRALGSTQNPNEPVLPLDYFTLASSDEQRACWRRFHRTEDPSEVFSPVVRELCDADATLPVRPLPPELGDAAESLAKLLPSASVYSIREDGPWVDVLDLAADELLVTTTVDHLAGAIPRRSEIVGSSKQREQMLAYFRRGVPTPCGVGPQVSPGLCEHLCTRELVPCPGGDGQCFVLGAGLTDVCKELP